MKEQEQPIRHQRDSKPEVRTHYERTRTPVGIGWMPQADISTTNVFPWRLLTQAETPHEDNGRRIINQKFLQSLSPDQAKRIFSQESTPDQDVTELSRRGENFIEAARFSFDQLAKYFVENNGRLDPDQLFANLSYVDFMAHIAETIPSQKEYTDIMIAIDAMLVRLERLRLQVMAYVEADQPIPADLRASRHKDGTAWI